MIYEEAQGNSLIRTLQHHKNSKNESLPQLQGIIGNFFEGISTKLQRTELAWLTRRRITTIIVCTANEIQCIRDTKEEYWRKRSRRQKNEIKFRKRIQAKISSNEELAELTLEAKEANLAIEAIQQTYKTAVDENLQNTTKMTYMKIMKNINKEIRTKENTQLEW
jgi:hypothetical protein